MQALWLVRVLRTLLSTTVQRAVLTQAKVYLDEVGARKQLNNHTRRHDGRNTEFHERTTVRRQNDTHPEERIRAITRHDAVQWNLRRYQVNGQDNGSPHDALLERHWCEHDGGTYPCVQAPTPQAAPT